MLLFGESEEPKYLVLFNKLNNQKTHIFQAKRKINGFSFSTIHHIAHLCFNNNVKKNS